LTENRSRICPSINVHLVLLKKDVQFYFLSKGVEQPFTLQLGLNDIAAFAAS
jgi:hypothetical protein